MGINKPTYKEAYAYARQRAQELGSIQRIVETETGFRIGGENKMEFYYPNSLGWTVYPIY